MPNEFARLRDAITSLTFRSRLRDATTPLRAFSLMTGIEMTCFLELFFNAYIYISRCLFKGFQKCTEVYRHRFWSTEVDFGRPRSTMKKRRFFRRFFTFLDIFSRSTFFVYGRCYLHFYFSIISKHMATVKLLQQKFFFESY